jgi:organic radical activating enzyme
MNKIYLPGSYNYCAVFLTLSCNLKCSYCINIMSRSRSEIGKTIMDKELWIEGLNRIEVRDDLPISIQGGEPTTHPEFYEIINGVDKPMDLITNLQFDIRKFIRLVSTKKFKRNAPYAAIRVSYHPEQMNLQKTAENVDLLLQAGYQVGVWMVEHPKYKEELENARFVFGKYQIDFRVKELLGKVGDRVYGTIKYPDSVGSNIMRTCECKTTELIIAPNGSVHRCHSDLYNGREGVGFICDPEFKISDTYRYCNSYGSCSACDVKVKTNRFQIFGHTSVDIINLK